MGDIVEISAIPFLRPGLEFFGEGVQEFLGSIAFTPSDRQAGLSAVFGLKRPCFLNLSEFFKISGYFK